MLIHQFYDIGLAHASYAIISEGKMAVIDPARNPHAYYDFAAGHYAKITAVIETHPHADFVSSHLEIYQKTGATIYVSRLVGAAYPYKGFDDGDNIKLGNVILKAINTPGHSPDSICIIAEEQGRQQAIFTGDTLFAGDVGRPDLRESAGNVTAKKEELARQLYHSTRQKLMTLPGDVIVYPAHGPGSLCGKNISADLQSTISRELLKNYALQPMGEAEFVDMLIAEQPFAPRYFGYNVALNKQGALPFGDSLKNIPRIAANDLIEGILVIDTRPAAQFKKGHIKGSFNLQNGDKFETWLGSIVNPGEPFYLAAHNVALLQIMAGKAAKIGYEQSIKGLFLVAEANLLSSPQMDHNYFSRYPDDYTIIDLRNPAEVASKPVFEKAINIPLYELRERLIEIPTNKPIAVHCAAGYRSAAGSSIVAAYTDAVPVYDFGEAIAGLLVP